jgi:outer membrane protein assembly factor BamB
MRIRSCSGLAALLLAASAAAPAEVVGWRGNWTGKFPGAKVPTVWHRVSPLTAGLRTQAAKPKGPAASGSSALDGVASEWLVLGPFTPADPAKAVEEPFIPNEADVQPDEGEKVGDKAWKKAPGDGSLMNLDAQLPGGSPGMAAYAHAYLYSETGGKAVMRVANQNCLGMRIWVNGKQLYGSDKPGETTVRADLAKGWNRVLFKVVRGDEKKQYCDKHYLSVWKFQFFLYALGPYEHVSKNVVWATRMPGMSGSTPLVVGDRIFAMSEFSDLVCLDRKTGRILWIRPSTYYHAASDEERRTVEGFQKVAPMMEELAKINDQLAGPGDKPDSLFDKKRDLEKNVARTLAGSDLGPHRMPKPDVLHAGYTLPTPVSDGKHVWVWPGSGVAACYDLDGNRRWISLPLDQGLDAAIEHCYSSSPVLAGGNLIAHAQDTIAFDAATGREAWRSKDMRGRRRLVGSLVPFSIGGTDAVYACVDIFRASDGKVLWTRQGGGDLDWTTPVCDGGVFYELGSLTYGIRMLRPKAAGESVGIESLGVLPVPAGDAYDKLACVASPLVHEGLAYSVDMMGRVRVCDTATRQLVYEKDLFFPEVRTPYPTVGSCLSSPVLMGGNIYVTSHTGVTVVFKPGRKFEPVSVNRLELDLNPTQWYEQPESFASSLVTDGEHIFIRGGEYIYCIGEK